MRPAYVMLSIDMRPAYVMLSIDKQKYPVHNVKEFHMMTS